MDARELVIALAEKTGLVAAAALVVALAPPLRRRLLGLGMPKTPFLPVVLGMCLAMWGAKSGLSWLGVSINVRAIGIFIAAILGGRFAGPATGLFAGAFFVFRVEPTMGAIGWAESMLDGALAGLVAVYLPALFRSAPRAFGAAFAIQATHVIVLSSALLVLGEPNYAAAWPAHLVKLLANSAGIALFVSVVRLVVAREEAAVALVEAQAQADATALEALRRRLEPHFLFNALNALRATIRLNPSVARAMVSDLADLYRYILTHPSDATLREEVHHASSYLAIERVRLGPERLQVRQEIDPDTELLVIPPLLLQPLVENAVRHGIGTHDGQGTVTISAHRENTDLVIEVRNESSGPALEITHRGSGVALRTLRERLAKRYRGQATLELDPIAHGMTARIRLPWPAARGTVSEKSAA